MKPRIGITPCTRVDDYVESVRRAGAEPVVLSNRQDPRAVLDRVDGILLTGGLDVDPALYGEAPHPATEASPERDRFEVPLSQAALERDVPVLAICRGVQVLNVAAGGTLVQDIPSQEPSDIEHAPAGKRAERVHVVDIEPGSRLARIVGARRIATNSSHHQSVRRTATELHVTARSEDGIVEGLEPRDPAWWAVAVQWHPEELTATDEDWDRRLFSAFAAAVRDAGRD